MQYPYIFRQILEATKVIASQLVTRVSDNKGVYESEDVIDFYTTQSILQEPEAAILNELKPNLPNMSMLDIGVGAGRTAEHFATLAKDYLGIDYSKKMIDVCIKKFNGSPPKIRFLASDARTLKQFSDESFDFVLFSFNGIDYMSHEERLETLKEIRRIIRHGGYFCFSTHNLSFMTNQCSLILSKHPMVLASRIISLIEMRVCNGRNAWKTMRRCSKTQEYALVNDGAFNFRLKTYYVTPIQQLKQLSEVGYSNTKMYSLANGQILETSENLVDNWIYFLTMRA